MLSHSSHIKPLSLGSVNHMISIEFKTKNLVNNNVFDLL